MILWLSRPLHCAQTPESGALSVKNSSKYFDWTQPEMGRKFRFNKFTYELDYRHYVTGMNLKTGEVKYPRAWVFKVLYKCEKI